MAGTPGGEDYPPENQPPPQNYPPANPPEQPYPQNYPPPGYYPQGGYPPQGFQPGGIYSGGQPYAFPPNNHMGLGILAIFCCWPFAIPSLINSSQVQTRWMMGDQAGAHAAAEEAKKWANIGIWLGVGGIVLYLLFILIVYVILGATVLSNIPRTVVPGR